MSIQIYIPELNLYPELGATVYVPDGVSITYQASYLSDDPEQYYRIIVRMLNIRGGPVVVGYVRSGEPVSLFRDADYYAVFASSVMPPHITMAVTVNLVTPDGSGGWIIGDTVADSRPSSVIDCPHLECYLVEPGIQRPVSSAGYSVPTGLKQLTCQLKFIGHNDDNPDQMYRIQVYAEVPGLDPVDYYVKSDEAANFVMDANTYYGYEVQIQRSIIVRVTVNLVTPDGSGGWIIGDERMSSSVLGNFEFSPYFLSLRSVRQFLTDAGYPGTSYGSLGEMQPEGYAKSTISIMELLEFI